MWASGDSTTTHSETVLVPRFHQKHYIQLEEETPSVPVCSQSSSVLCAHLLNKPRNKGTLLVLKAEKMEN